MAGGLVYVVCEVKMEGALKCHFIVAKIAKS